MAGEFILIYIIKFKRMDVYFKGMSHSWSSRTPMVFMLTLLRSPVSSSTPELVAGIERRTLKWLRHVIKMSKQMWLRQI
jgi:hypothetical protein